MATIEEAVREKTINDAAVKTLIGSRLYPLVIPQDVPLSAVAYQKISAPKTSSHSGASGLVRSRFQFTCASNTYTEVKALSAAVIACWWGWRGTSAGVRIDGALVDNDSDGDLERGAQVRPVVTIDVVIWHSE
jgi:hypothetical protein